MTSRSELVEQLRTLGVERGGVLAVHTAFSEVRPVEGGPHGLIEALLETIGPEGTLVMPSMSDDDDRPFDVATTPCIGVGIVAETFRQMPGVLRSDNPHAFAAIGPHAAAITAPHPLEVPHGPDSPPGRLPNLHAQILLLGVGHDANTTIHVAENLAGVRYRQQYHVTIDRDGEWQRFEYGEVDHCCENFAKMDAWLDAGGKQRYGRVGQAEARLMRARDLISIASSHLAEDELVFLHASDCDECAAARASLLLAHE
ncbi:MAG: AAC(3) family N-acetyltransferase [Acidobacteria bacterium]|nr:AAC(3) family N-acetyltransferase [Acidobacteriota bacterium]